MKPHELPRKVILSGGGTVGVCAFAGAIERYDRLVGPIHHIAGVSAGAVIAGAYACGRRSLVDLAVELLARRPLSGFSPGWVPYPYFFRSGRLKQALRSTMGIEMGSTLSRLSVGTFNARTRLQMVWDSRVHSGIPVWEIVYSSMCIPFAFKPHKLGNAYHFDGGITSNFPVDDVFGNDGEGVAGIYKHSSNKDHGNPDSAVELIGAIIDGMIMANVHEDTQGSKADLIPVYVGGPTLKWKWTEEQVRLLASAGAEAVEKYVARKVESSG